MKKLEWFERTFTFNLPLRMLPFFSERLEGTIARIESKVVGKADGTLSCKAEGKWSIKQNIGHLAEVDNIALKRIDEMLNGISPMSPAVFEPQLDYNSQSIETVLNLFKKNRKKNLERYNMLTESELARFSVHPRLNVRMTPVDLAFFDAEHDDHHLVRISEILKIVK